MAVSYKKGPGVYKISPSASVFLANQMWYASCQYGVSPGTIKIFQDRMEYCRLGMTFGILHFYNTPLFMTSEGVLHYFGDPESPSCSQVQVWAIELMNA